MIEVIINFIIISNNTLGALTSQSGSYAAQAKSGEVSRDLLERDERCLPTCFVHHMRSGMMIKNSTYIK
jgi:hypothetical protein